MRDAARRGPSAVRRAPPARRRQPRTVWVVGWLLGVSLASSCQTVGAPRTWGEGAPPARAGEAEDSLGDRSAGGPLPLPAERGLWVVRTTLVHPDSVRAMVRRAARAGFNTLLVQVRGRGDSYFADGLEPRADPLRGQPDFDPLALAITDARRLGLKVHAWINVHLVSSAARLPADPEHLVHARPDLLAVSREIAADVHGMDPADPAYLERLRRHADESRSRLEGLYSSPSHPDVKERVYRVAMDLVERYDLDGIHLDYVRYPSDDFDYSRDALARFQSWIRGWARAPLRLAELEGATAENPLALADSLPGAWSEFRRTQITDLVGRVSRGVKRRRPEAVVSAAVFPDPASSLDERHQDWGTWIRAGIIDVVVPMAYTPDEVRFEELIADATAVAGPQRVWAGVGAHLTTYEGAVLEIGIARRLGVRGVMLFSYDWAVRPTGREVGTTLLQRVGEAGFAR